ncbi:MAG: VWA domain-containing protein [Bacteroidales bacterium]|nr:VWA domain-containing protein [Bacteroidales bacterium]
MFRFAHPNYLYLLLLVPLIALIMIFFSRKRKKAMNRFGDANLISHLMPAFSGKRMSFKAILLLVAFTLQVFVMAGPQFGSKIETMKRRGIELMIAIDVSNSMNAQDITPSRLEMAKMAVSRLIDNLGDDRVGLIVFAGQPYVQLPITTDYPSAKMFLQSISTEMVATQGTAIGAAIQMCANSFSDNADINKAILVITDGENHEDDAVAAAKAAAQNGIRVYTVGMGTAKGAPVPAKAGSMRDFLKDRDGNVAMSRIDEAALAQIASAGDGAYIPANNIRNGISALLYELNSIEKTDFEAKVYTDYNDRFQYVEFLVLLILIFDLLILSRKNPRLSGFDIFTRKSTATKDLFIQPNSEKK